MDAAGPTCPRWMGDPTAAPQLSAEPDRERGSSSAARPAAGRGSPSSGSRTAGWGFACADNGIGIAPEYADKVFVIFQRLHARDEYAGTGIGLALCKKIVEHSGGRIWIDTAHTDGTRIAFTLPVPEAPEVAETAEAVETVGTTTEGSTV